MVPLGRTCAGLLLLLLQGSVPACAGDGKCRAHVIGLPELPPDHVGPFEGVECPGFDESDNWCEAVTAADIEAWLAAASKHTNVVLASSEATREEMKWAALEMATGTGDCAMLVPTVLRTRANLLGSLARLVRQSQTHVRTLLLSKLCQLCHRSLQAEGMSETPAFMDIATTIVEGDAFTQALHGNEAWVATVDKEDLRCLPHYFWDLFKGMPLGLSGMTC
eukprot:NODE_21569_length_746_cov_4.237480.p1 GENE.NODE_21569_length_746_cov_4.237480~~NODE_21569_length_746_cov_4.237480.p1  ORF type:complete len:237 (-),score=72.66 NODE_21569_length_746_cov_4.237480:36-698(-)